MSGEFSQRVMDWRRGGQMIPLAGRRLFVRRHDGEGPLLLFLHGFPSSSYDWKQVLPLLPGFAAVAFDFLGFGLSEKPHDVVYSLFDQADLTEQLIGSEARRVVIVAHDMGTSVATELLARDLERSLSFAIDGVLLLNGGMIVERASLTLAQTVLRSPIGPLLARFSTRRVFVSQFGRLFSQAHPLEPAEAEEQWALWRHAGGSRIAHRLIRYINERVAHAQRWHRALSDWPGDLRFAWGMRDPVATPHVLTGLRELRPAAPVTELADLGHYPQIEQPAAIAGQIAALASSVRRAEARGGR
ncbi:MAG: alpha/beta fold hydrolase [Solirubrobacteraceae bacterium]